MLQGTGTRIDNWDDLRYLLAVHKTGSMSAAARLLTTNPATVSRRLARLAETLGYELFHKTPEGWVASDAIALLLESVKSFEGEIDSFLNSAASQSGELRGTIAIGVPGSLANGVLGPRIGELVAQHPGVQLSLHAQTYRETLGENDLIISPLRPQQGRLIVRPIGKVRANVYTMPETPRDGAWIGLLRDFDTHEPMQQALSLMGGRPPSVRLETMHDVAGAIRLTRLPGLTLRIDASHSPEMTLYDPSNPDIETPLYLCYHETRRHDPLLQAVIDWVSDAFAKVDAI
ncbi:probable transcriptional regulator transcription regulator protein [Pseudooceanicola batsensis HTCC2597]|uniref:Probable transcriptional regulator transcription regulator protein n=1 Tax=Pseudooceanicola batsensis (strain ATCC BAA-863 / DSM 15984 / KCTC 12145 / HTCC2597) TaxID=252305 RepID=A3TXH8_PSEBH|nr:LysR family transcriptional regulator [Pseudooceanicola batsensis]EAQ03538.1 probable transcriptional regulator transcription regulator protein [Pseudooceanicola batsensis HTCC2597]